MAELIRMMEKDLAHDFGGPSMNSEILSPDISTLGLADGKPYIDLTPDGKLRKKIKKTGYGSRPETGDIVLIVYDSYREDGSRIESNAFTDFVVGDDQVIDAFGICVNTMHLGERVVLISDSEYAFGRLGHRPRYQPDERIIFHLSFTRNQGRFNHRNYMPLTVRIAMVKKMIQRGHFLSVRGLTKRAYEAYSCAVMYLRDYKTCADDEAFATDEELLLIEYLVYNSYSSLARVHLKLGQMKPALIACDQVLKVKPDDYKGLYRKGVCLAALGNKRKAILYLQKALEHDHHNPEIMAQLKKLDDEVAKEMYASATKRSPKKAQSYRINKRSNKRGAKDKEQFQLEDLTEDVFARRTDHGIETSGHCSLQVESTKQLLKEFGSKLSVLIEQTEKKKKNKKASVVSGKPLGALSSAEGDILEIIKQVKKSDEPSKIIDKCLPAGDGNVTPHIDNEAEADIQKVEVKLDELSLHKDLNDTKIEAEKVVEAASEDDQEVVASVQVEQCTSLEVPPCISEITGPEEQIQQEVQLLDDTSNQMIKDDHIEEEIVCFQTQSTTEALENEADLKGDADLAESEDVATAVEATGVQENTITETNDQEEVIDEKLNQGTSDEVANDNPDIEEPESVESPTDQSKEIETEESVSVERPTEDSREGDHELEEPKSVECLTNDTEAGEPEGVELQT